LLYIIPYTKYYINWNCILIDDEELGIHYRLCSTTSLNSYVEHKKKLLFFENAHIANSTATKRLKFPLLYFQLCDVPVIKHGWSVIQDYLKKQGAQIFYSNSWVTGKNILDNIDWRRDPWNNQYSTIIIEGHGDESSSSIGEKRNKLIPSDLPDNMTNVHLVLFSCCFGVTPQAYHSIFTHWESIGGFIGTALSNGTKFCVAQPALVKATHAFLHNLYFSTKYVENNFDVPQALWETKMWMKNTPREDKIIWISNKFNISQGFMKDAIEFLDELYNEFSQGREKKYNR